MITIDLDNIIFSLQKFGGASVYWNHLISRVVKDNRFKVNLLNTSKNFRGIPAFSNAQIFHSSHFRTCLSPTSKVVSTVHDLNYELGLINTGFKSTLNTFERKLSYFTADALICISDSTKKDLLKVYPQLLNRCPIYVIHHGFTELVSKRPEEFNPIQLYGHYVLYVGGRQNYKNFSVALEGYEESKLWQQGMKLICTGSPFTESEILQIKKMNLSDYVFSIGKVGEGELGALYENAHCLLYTSTYEGFGLPLIEAMSKSCPVIASNSSCIPEVVDQAAILVSPSDVSAVAKSLIDLMDTEKRKTLTSLGKERVKSFSWDKSAQLHMEVYQNLALGKN